LVTAATGGQFIAQVRRELIEPTLLAPRLRQDMPELDHVRVVEVIQVHPHHRFGNAQHLHEEIPNSHQDVILGGGAARSPNVAVNEYAVAGRGLQTDEMFIGRQVTKDTLAKRNRSTRKAAVDTRNSPGDMRLPLSIDLVFMGVTHVRGHEPSLVVAVV
jgi:hypothetical protein